MTCVSVSKSTWNIYVKTYIYVFSVLQGSAIRWGGKIQHLLVVYFLSNISAKYYENPTMLSRVIAKNIGDVFETQCISLKLNYLWVNLCRTFLGVGWTKLNQILEVREPWYNPHVCLMSDILLRFKTRIPQSPIMFLTPMNELGKGWAKFSSQYLEQWWSMLSMHCFRFR